MKATGTSQALLMAYEKAKKPISTSQRWVRVVTALSTAAIIVSYLSCKQIPSSLKRANFIMDGDIWRRFCQNPGFAFMGISLDTDPDWPGWIILDSVCAVIFVAEVVVKSYVPSCGNLWKEWLESEHVCCYQSTSEEKDRNTRRKESAEDPGRFFPTCQVRVVRFYHSCSPPPPPPPPPSAPPPPSPPASPPPPLHPLPCSLPPCQLFAKLFANFRTQWALLDLNCKGVSALGTAGPQPGTFRAQ